MGSRLIGRWAKGAWSLSDQANESEKGFLLNHLISEELRSADGSSRVSNADPITGQAGWYDVRVRIRKCDAGEPQQSFPQFTSVPALPGMAKKKPKWRAWFAGRGETDGGNV